MRLFILNEYFYSILKRKYILNKMKKFIFLPLLILVLNANMSLFAQEITFVPQDTLLQGKIGDEMIFYIDVTNISSLRQTVFVVRTMNDLPPDWFSALCFDVCFSPELDSIATTTYFGSSPLDPQETRELSLHVTAVNNDGSAHVQLQAGTFNNPNDRIIVNFTATTIPVSVDTENSSPLEYDLAQNYPNPFNPSTRISYAVPETSPVTIKVYDLTGQEVAVLVNEVKEAGTYELIFDARNFASGVYIYRMIAGDFSSVRKMNLLK